MSSPGKLYQAPDLTQDPPGGKLATKWSDIVSSVSLLQPKKDQKLDAFAPTFACWFNYFWDEAMGRCAKNLPALWLGPGRKSTERLRIEGEKKVLLDIFNEVIWWDGGKTTRLRRAVPTWPDG